MMPRRSPNLADHGTERTFSPGPVKPQSGRTFVNAVLDTTGGVRIVKSGMGGVNGMSQNDVWGQYVDEAWLGSVPEAILDADIPIVDPHHHLMNWPFQFGIAETVADFCTGHKVDATIHVEAHGHYCSDGPELMRPVGETEYLVSAVTQIDRVTCPTKICAGIVGHVDVKQGAAVEEPLAAHIEAGRGRFRGIRVNLYWSMTADGAPWTPSPISSLIEEPDSREALACLSPLGLSCDLVAFHSNLPDVVRTARAFENTLFIVNHMGGPMTPEAHPNEEKLAQVWRANIDELARCSNVRMKLGGWLNPMLSRSIPSVAALRRLPAAPSSSQIADALRPYVEHCIDRLGPKRCMFESNFPIDKNFTRYATLWNAFKRLSSKYSQDERRALLGGTAAATYRIA
jgi:L-fuconolactonase